MLQAEILLFQNRIDFMQLMIDTEISEEQVKDGETKGKGSDKTSFYNMRGGGYRL